MPKKEMQELIKAVNKNTIAVNNLEGTNKKQLASQVLQQQNQKNKGINPGAPTGGPNLPGGRGGPRPATGSPIVDYDAQREAQTKEKRGLGGLAATAITGAAFKGGKGDKSKFGIQDIINILKAPAFPVEGFNSLKTASQETGDIMVAGFEEARAGVDKFDKSLGDINRRYGFFKETVSGRGSLGELLLRPLKDIPIEGKKTIDTLAELGITEEQVAKAATELGDNSNAMRSVFALAGGQFDANAKELTQLAAIFKKAGVETKNFGKLGDHVSKTFGEMWKGTGKAVKGTKALQTQLHALASVTGNDVNVVTNEFNTQLENLAFVGMQDAIEKFTDLKTLSETTGIAMENIVKSTKKFDDFKSAGQQVGQLNAALRGSYTNSRAFMAALGDPAKQMNIVQDAIIKAHKAGTFKLSKNTAVRYAQIRQIQKAAGDISRTDALKLLGAVDEDARKESAKLQAKMKADIAKKAIDSDPAKRAKQSEAHFGRITKAIERNLSMTEKQTLLAEKNFQQFVKGTKESSTNLQNVLVGSIKAIDTVSARYLKFFKPLNKQIESYSKMKAITGTRGMLGAMLFGDEKGEGIKAIREFIGASAKMQIAVNTQVLEIEKKFAPGSEFRDQLLKTSKELKQTAQDILDLDAAKEKLQKKIDSGEVTPGEDGPDVGMAPEKPPDTVIVNLMLDKTKLGEVILEIQGNVMGVRAGV